jgi:3-carboxy-cis,cis-muconate cycloisomerase
MEIDGARMRSNLDLAQGLIMAEAVSMGLAAKIGKADAHRLVEELAKKAIAEKRNLQEVMSEEPRIAAQLSASDLAKLFEPMAYQGAAQTFIDRLVASTKSRGNHRT